MSREDKKIEDVKIMDQKELGRLLERIGKDILERGEVEILGRRFVLPERLEVETEYKKKEGRNKLEIELKWYGDDPSPHPSPLMGEGKSLPPKYLSGGEGVTKGFSGEISATAVKIATLAELSPWKVINFNYPTSADNAILIALPKREFRAYSTVCTHKGKSLLWDDQLKRLHCPAHDAVFSAETGKKIAGPGGSFLKKIQLQIKEGNIFAVGIDQEL